MITKLYIKNMVCPRCIATVKSIFNKLKIETVTVQLGEAAINSNITVSKKSELEKLLTKNGFELLQDNKSKLISQIKTIIIDHIHHKQDVLNVNFSTLLSEKLDHEYTSLSKLFSSVEGITIERFILTQKIEKVKELLCYGEQTLSEIAYQMNYSSPAHLSSQFKKETGMTPSKFKAMKNPNRKPIDSL